MRQQCCYAPSASLGSCGRAYKYTLGFVVRMSCCFTVYTLSLLHHWSIVLKTRRNMSGMHPFEIFFVLSIKYLNFISCGWHLVKGEASSEKGPKRCSFEKLTFLIQLQNLYFCLTRKRLQNIFILYHQQDIFVISFQFTSRLELRWFETESCLCTPHWCLHNSVSLRHSLY